MQTTIIDGIRITYDHPHLMVNNRQLFPDEVVALKKYLNSHEGERIVEMLLAERDESTRERHANR